MGHFSAIFASVLIRGERTMGFRNRRPYKPWETEGSASAACEISYTWISMLGFPDLRTQSWSASCQPLQFPEHITQFCGSMAVFIVLYPSRTPSPFSFPWLTHNHYLSRSWGVIMSWAFPELPGWVTPTYQLSWHCGYQSVLTFTILSWNDWFKYLFPLLDK